MFIIVHVYDDGDVELTKVVATEGFDVYFEVSAGKQLLIDELLDYGLELDTVTYALDKLESVPLNEPIRI